MKPVLILLVMFSLVCKVYSQDLIFSINQYGVAYKDEVTKKYGEAEVKSSDIIITLQDKTVKVMDNTTNTFLLEKMSGQNNNIKHLYTQIWKATDLNKAYMQFKFTVNVDTHEAMVEIGNKDYRNYYFGKYTYGNLNDPAKTAEAGGVAN